MSQEHCYDIRDTWMALRIAAKTFIISILIVWAIPFLVVSAASEEELQYFSYDGAILIKVLQSLTVILLMQSFRIYAVNSKYSIDMVSGKVRMPSTDLENSLLDIVLFKPYWNLMRSTQINASDIENIYLDTKRWSTKTKSTKWKKHVRYNINLAGRFGSANLQFINRQKRDEVRNALQQACRVHGNRDVDRKVAEIS